ncbi:hypothetical protein GcM1_230045 [Golovinomyces cichoracearum]|uniref:Uncharacterized protein n=1 Tax=Golovinomyces cichoracearum TaxID=62708 RepID=A0A420IN52_9PEZI|nr:hypothetical protein GcM1_230045 [Golovinomyces cichoracearum]
MPDILNRKNYQDKTVKKSSSKIINSANSVKDTQTLHCDSFSEEQEEFSSLREDFIVIANSNPTRKMPADLRDLTLRYMGNSKLTAQFFRQIRTAFEDADIELTPKCFLTSS